jgi:hypothetical protein
MNVNLIAERVSPYYEKVSSLINPAAAFQVFLSLSLLTFATQGIPFLAVHTANIINSVQLGYWLAGGGAALFFASLLWILFNEN